MTFDDAITYEPTRDEIMLELRRHGQTMEEFTAYCQDFNLKANAPGVLLGFLGY
jgi:hypothetical protein